MHEIVESKFEIARKGMDVGCFFKLSFKTSDKIEFISILGAKLKLKNERYWNETKQSSEISRLEDHLISWGGRWGRKGAANNRIYLLSQMSGPVPEGA